MLVDGHAELRLVGASSDTARALELVQQRAGDGPGVLCTRTDEIVIVTDLKVDRRWPQITDSLQGRDVRGVLSAPVGLRGHAVGNLNLFDDTPRSWTEIDIDRARSLAGVIGTWLQMAISAHQAGQQVSQLQHTLSAATRELEDR